MGKPAPVRALAPLAFLALLLTPAPSIGRQELDAEARVAPNILLILVDDLGWSQTSEAIDPRLPESRSTYLETPRIARLMAEGLRFTRAYAVAPMCTPSRRGLLCGTSAARSGAEGDSNWVPAEHLTLPKALALASPTYRCAHLGKWGNKMVSKPKECGYHLGDGMTTNKTPGSAGALGDPRATGFVDEEDPKRTDSVTRRAIEFMGQQVAAATPFYVQVSYYAPHLPAVSRQATLDKYERKGEPDRAYTPAWAAMVEELDTAIGHLLDALDELEVAGDTYVFLTSDNGGHGSMRSGDTAGHLATNHPLSGEKHDLAEGGIRVPLVVRGPGVAPGQVCRVPVCGYDFLPTFHALAGGAPDSLGPNIDGTSLAPLLASPSGEGFERPAGALFFHRPTRTSIRQSPRAQSAVIAGEHKLMLTWGDEGEIASRSLHRVDADPRESAELDLATREPALADRLQERLLAHLAAVQARMPGAARTDESTGRRSAGSNDDD